MTTQQYNQIKREANWETMIAIGIWLMENGTPELFKMYELEIASPIQELTLLADLELQISKQTILKPIVEPEEEVLSSVETNLFDPPKYVSLDVSKYAENSEGLIESFIDQAELEGWTEEDFMKFLEVGFELRASNERFYQLLFAHCKK